MDWNEKRSREKAYGYSRILSIHVFGYQKPLPKWRLCDDNIFHSNDTQGLFVI